MKQTTTRLVSIAGVLVLGAFAIGLAQIDSRNEPSEPLAGKWIGADETPGTVEPIQLDPSERVVRANNNQITDGLQEPPERLSGWEPSLQSGLKPELPSIDSDATNGNPLRAEGQAVVSAEGMESAGDAVVPAAGQLPDWLGNQATGPTPTEAGGLPPLPAVGGNVPGTQDVPDARVGPEQTPRTDTPRFPIATNPGSSALPPLNQPARPMEQNPRVGLPVNQNPAGGLPGPMPSSPTVPTESGMQQPSNLPSLADSGNVRPGPPRENQIPPGYGAEQPQLPASRIFPDNGAANRNALAAESMTRNPVASLASTQLPSSGLVSSRPGERNLEGAQAPSIVIEKRAPAEVQVGKPATFVFTIRNAGTASAHGVTFVDMVPEGCRFVKAMPDVRPDSARMMKWQLGEMKPGEERTISVQYVPEIEGEIGSTAMVQLTAQAAVRTVATQPKIELQFNADDTLLIGSNTVVRATLVNTGSGVARNVRLEADLTEHLSHQNGPELSASFGDMSPNDSTTIELLLTGVQPGQAGCQLRVVVGEDDDLHVEQPVSIAVQAPSLMAKIDGPKRRYLERPAKYTLTLSNQGSAAATDLDFVVQLPRGLRFMSSTNPAVTFDRSTNQVNVGLPELAAGQDAPFEITVLPVELGPQAIRFNATAALNMRAETQAEVLVEGQAELAFTIAQDNMIVEQGATTTYSVQVTNVGNKPDKNVQLAIQFPSSAKLLDVNSDVKYEARGNQIVFAPVPEMKNRDQMIFRFQLQHSQVGQHNIQAQLQSANWPQPFRKDANTQVYDDR